MFRFLCLIAFDCLNDEHALASWNSLGTRNTSRWHPSPFHSHSQTVGGLLFTHFSFPPSTVLYSCRRYPHRLGPPTPFNKPQTWNLSNLPLGASSTSSKPGIQKSKMVLQRKLWSMAATLNYTSTEYWVLTSVFIKVWSDERNRAARSKVCWRIRRSPGCSSEGIHGCVRRPDMGTVCH